jgi:general stress protein 26
MIASNHQEKYSADISPDEHTRSQMELWFESIDDPRYYDLIINSDWISIEPSVSLIAHAGIEKFELLARKSNA